MNVLGEEYSSTAGAKTGCGEFSKDNILERYNVAQYYKRQKYLTQKSLKLILSSVTETPWRLLGFHFSVYPLSPTNNLPCLLPVGVSWTWINMSKAWVI